MLCFRPKQTLHVRPALTSIFAPRRSGVTGTVPATSDPVKKSGNMHVSSRSRPSRRAVSVSFSWSGSVGVAITVGSSDREPAEVADVACARRCGTMADGWSLSAAGTDSSSGIAIAESIGSLGIRPSKALTGVPRKSVLPLFLREAPHWTECHFEACSSRPESSEAAFMELGGIKTTAWHR